MPVVLGYRAAHAFNTTVVLTFGGAVAHYLGAPNDESIIKHPLSARGLEPYGVYVVQESSWARMIGQVSAVPHPVFAPNGRRHYVLTFQDCTFECVASEVEVETIPGTVRPAEAAIKKFRSLTRSA